MLPAGVGHMQLTFTRTDVTVRAGREIGAVIVFAEKHGLATIAALHDMMRDIGDHNAGGSGHGFGLP